MAGQPSVSHRLLIWLVLSMLMGGIEAGLTSVLVGSDAINAITTYTWAITFNAGAPYHPLTLNFPTQATVLSNRTCTIGGTTQVITSTNNSITITSSINSSSVSIICSNIKNPPSAISTNSFSYHNSNDMTVNLPNVNQVQFKMGTLASCPWSFTLCTEQSNSELNIAFSAVNDIPSGTNYFLIGYFGTWPNHRSKGLTTNGASLTCSYSTNAGSDGSFSPADSCFVNQLTIQMQFTAAGPITAGKNIVVKIKGVTSPPTMQTVTSQDYFIYTTDSSKLNKIDGAINCAISNICVSNQTVGTFTNSTMIVNANYGFPEVKFPITPFVITIQQLDTIEVSYSPFSSLSSCNTLIIYRSGNPLYRMTSPTSTATSITFTMPSGSGFNTESGFAITAYLECTSFLMPPSETPVSLAFNFRRNSDLYLQLSATVNAVATTFNSSRGRVTQSATAMTSPSAFTFNFLLGQDLSNTPAFVFTFPNDFVINTPSCSASVISLTVTSVACSNNGNVVTVNFTASSSSKISAGRNVTVILTSGVTNPVTPGSYSIGMTTYYISSVSTSKSETSTTAFTTTITEIANYPVTLTPPGLTVYTPTDIIFSFTPSIDIPISSTFYIEFPPNVTAITTNTNLLKLGTTALPLVGNSLSSNSISVTFISGTQINAGSTISITIRLTTPSNIGTYSYVQLIISKNATPYLSTRNSLYLNVNAVNSMSITVIPTQPITGKTTSYQFSIFLTIPHSSAFIVQVDVPSDTKFITAGSNCTSCNASSMSPTNSTTFSFIANNSAGSQTYAFTISSFINPRSVGPSLPWGIATKTVSPTNLISYSYANATISEPNTLVATLDQTDSYFRSNSNPVKMTLTFSNTLITGDYILFSFTSDSYTASTVTCSSIYGTCLIQGTPTNVTNVKMTPNTTSIISNSLFLILEGLTSASGTSYSYITNISVSTLTFDDRPIDSGKMTYSISCGAFSSNLCKQCYSNGSCINCYTGFYLLGSVCLSSCGPLSSYMSYNSSTTGSCVPCINSCQTCFSQTLCRTCISGYYLFISDSSCRLTCPTSNGYYLVGTNCTACTANCLECTSSSNSCTRCDSSTLLMNGACQNGCGSSNFYQLNGQCLSCNESCATCFGPGASNCYNCSGNYHMYLSQCVAQCPNGTASNPATGNCGCDSQCLTCTSVYTECTTCMNTSLWVLNGRCVSSCPQSTYPNARQCISCSSGCLSCTINTCTTCVNGSYLFNNKCYSDCNLISQQYDAIGATSCVLCPSGCDRCDTTNCTACLDDYTLTGTQCIKTCLLSNTCDLTSQVMPMPGLISLVVWLGISVIIHLLYHKNYLPYSIILLSGVIQFVLILALLSATQSPTARLLAADNGYLSQMRGLLGGAIAANYLENCGYLIIFLCYIKPLIANPRQIDVISNVVVLIIGTVTNFRFGLVAFARMFPKPNIFVKDASKLTPVHYLCLVSLCLDLMSVVACGLGLINAQKLSNTFMLSLDLIIVIIINMAITVWFVAAKKPDEYFEDTIKKYHTEDNAHNHTDEALPNEKNFSKSNMVGNESFNFDDFDRTENDEASYNKLTNLKSNANALDLAQDGVKENPLPVTVLARSKGKPDPNEDPNFENNIKSKRSVLKESPIVISKPDFAKSIDKDGKSVDENLSARKNHVITKNLSKDAIKSERKPIEPHQKNIVEVEESDYHDIQGHSDKPSGNVFNPKQRPTKPKKLKDQKSKGLEDSQAIAKGAAGRKADDPMKLMKKGDKKIGYFQSDAYSSNADGDDLQEIIKQKIWQSTIKLEKPSLSSGVESETAHEEISPSWFNIQNQRLDITDLEEEDQE